jgi:hypothetical protein
MVRAALRRPQTRPPSTLSAGGRYGCKVACRLRRLNPRLGEEREAVRCVVGCDRKAWADLFRRA